MRRERSELATDVQAVVGSAFALLCWGVSGWLLWNELKIDIPNSGEWLRHDCVVRAPMSVKPHFYKAGVSDVCVKALLDVDGHLAEAFASMVQRADSHLRHHDLNELMGAGEAFARAHPRSSTLPCWLSPSMRLARLTALPLRLNTTGGKYTDACGREPGDARNYVFCGLLMLLAISATVSALQPNIIRPRVRYFASGASSPLLLL